MPATTRIATHMIVVMVVVLCKMCRQIFFIEELSLHGHATVVVFDSYRVRYIVYLIYHNRHNFDETADNNFDTFSCSGIV